MTKKRIRITDGGIAIPLGNNTFLMRGRLHSQGGIGIGNGGKNDIEVEDGEVVKFNKDNIQVLSDQPMLNGISPANALLAGGNFNKIFKAQQNINGDNHGTYAEDGTEENIPDIVKKQKEWLKNWYAVRLPLLGKEHLQQYVDKGLNTKYIGEKDLTRKEKKDFLARGVAGMYIRGNRNLMKKVNRTDPTLTDIIVVSEQEPVIKSIYDSTTTPLHEYAHAVSIGYQNDLSNTNKEKISPADMYEQFITDFINNDKTKTGSSRYLSNDEEKYARIQELRYINDLDPFKTDYTIEDLSDFKKLRKSQELINELKGGGMDEQDIINALNTWASNTNDNKTDNIAYAKNGARIKYDRGGISWLIDKLFGNEDNKKINKSNKQAEPLNLEELKLRQAYAESGFDSNAKSDKDAMGLFQIRQLLLDDYNVANNTNYTLGDLKDDKLNMSIRDWKMDKNLSSDWAVKNNAPDSVIYAKALGGYNMGNTSFIKGLEKAKKDGVDIYNSMDWIDTKWFPKETVDYINFILRNQNNSLSRNQLAYEASKKKNFDKVEGIIKGFKNGGQINMKLKYKNKQDITDMVMNEILPHSTGERKKFLNGGTRSMIGNLSLNLLNGITQGVIGSINASKLRKMYDSLKRQSTFIPVTREHINTKVDVEPQLNLTAQTEYNLRRNAEMNTANAKVARSQARIAALDRIRQDNAIYSDKYNREAQLRNAEAKLQTKYNLVDVENKITDIREQNDFDMQKVIGKTNADTMEAQTWGQSVGNMLLNSGKTIMDYAQMNTELLKSNNRRAHEYLKSIGWIK